MEDKTKRLKTILEADYPDLCIHFVLEVSPEEMEYQRIAREMKV